GGLKARVTPDSPLRWPAGRPRGPPGSGDRPAGQEEDLRLRGLPPTPPKRARPLTTTTGLDGSISELPCTSKPPKTPWPSQRTSAPCGGTISAPPNSANTFTST